jgi:hypothetical protein
MTSISIGAAIALSLFALVGSQPRTAAMALVLSYFFALPVTIFATGANSAVFVCDIVLLAVLLRWGRTSIQRIRDVRVPGMPIVWALMAWVVVSRILVIFRLPTFMSFMHLGFYSLRFLMFAMNFVVLATLPLTRQDYRKLLGWICLLVAVVSVANIVSSAGLINLNFYVGDILRAGEQYVREDPELVHTFLLGFNRAVIGLFAYTAITLVLLRGWLGGKGWHVLMFALLPLYGFLLLDSFSRSAIIAIVVSLTVLGFRVGARRLVGLSFVLAIGGMVLVFLATDVRAWQERFAALFSAEAFRESTGAGRIESWQQVLGYLKGNPIFLIFGVGFYGYAAQFVRIAAVTRTSAGHNMYVHSLGELGVPGLTLLLILWTRLVQTFYRMGAGGNPDSEQQLVGRAMLAFLLGALASGVSQETLYPIYTMYGAASLLMFVFAATVAAYQAAPVPVPATLHAISSAWAQRGPELGYDARRV